MTQNNKPFTIDQIQEAFKKVKSGSDFPQLIQNLKTIGVMRYDNYVADGKTKYYGTDDFVAEGKPKYPTITINESSSSNKLKQVISIHQQGETDYLTFCNQAADAGVEKWVTNMLEMTVTYLDKQGNRLTVELIPQPQNKTRSL